MKLKDSIVVDLFLLLLVVLIGTAGYMLIEHWSIMDAVYMTIITVTTVGFGEVHSLDASGKIFTVFLIIIGLGTITFTLTSISSYLFHGKFYTYLLQRRMQKNIQNLKKHFIICGASDTSLVLMQELLVSQVPFVLIELNEQRLKKALDRIENCLFIKGDATQEDVLRQAGIQQAVGLVASLGNDHDDIFLIMTARELNKQMKIYAKIKEEGARKKYMLAGANVVINPYEIGGMRIASIIVRPKAVEFLDDLLKNPKKLRIEEVTIDEKSPLYHKTMTISEVQDILDARVIALRKNHDVEYRHRFHGQKITFEEGDCLFILGEKGD